MTLEDYREEKKLKAENKLKKDAERGKPASDRDAEEQILLANEAKTHAEEQISLVDEAKVHAEEAIIKADLACSKAEDAVQKALYVKAFPQEAAEIGQFSDLPMQVLLEARDKAEEVKKKAEEARDKAEEFRCKAEEARDRAEEAKHKAEEVITTSEEARSKAEEAKYKAEEVRNRAEEARNKAEEARNKAEEAFEIALDSARQAEFFSRRYHLVLEGSEDGLWDWDIEESTIFWNGRFFKMLGIPTNAVTPTEASLLERVHPEDRDRLQETIRAALKHEGRFEIQVRVQAETGKYIYCLARGKTQFNDQGKPTRMAGTITNMTEQVETAEKLQQYSRQLEQSNQDLEQFAAIASHDLKAPLRKIEQFGQWMRQAQFEGRGDDLTDYALRIATNAHQMSQLIDDLLGLSKVTLSEVRRDNIDLSLIAREIAHDLQEQELGRQVTFKIQDQLVVLADPNLMRSVLQNLLSNAWKFTAKKLPAVIEVGKQQQNGRWVYFVRDNGIGLDVSKAENLFRPFHRLNPKSEYPGTGIGLASVQRIIQHHGGRVWIEGALKQGATVYFTLSGE